MVLSAIDAATRRFAATLAGLDDADLRAPSPLPGWTRGHVVAHVILNAEAFVEVARARRTGDPGIMYPGGMDAREQAIVELSTSSADGYTERLAAAHAAFLAAWDPPPPDGPCASAPGLPRFEATTVPMRRLREVEVHHVDLGLPGLGYERWLDAYVELDLPLQWETVALRTDAPVDVVDETGRRWLAHDPASAHDPATTNDGPVAVDRRTLLAWVLDRAQVDGLPSLLTWGDRSRWEPATDPR